MLWDASGMKGYAIAGSDGHLGAVNDFLFDDTNWQVRWMVVDTGHWFPGRKVLLPIESLGRPEPVHRRFPVKLTMRQVKQSPDVNLDLPVSRQAETNVYDYYSWEPYWSAIYFEAGAIVAPYAAPTVRSVEAGDSSAADTAERRGDPHLRSVAAVTGYHVHASDGEIGHIEDFLIDDIGWVVRHIKVKTRNWWPGNEVLIPSSSVRTIDLEDRLVGLKINRKQVQNSPRCADEAGAARNR
jgi:uncharacterized protein YrrD